MQGAQEGEIHILQVTAWLMAIILSMGKILSLLSPEILIINPDFFQHLMMGILALVLFYLIDKHI